MNILLHIFMLILVKLPFIKYCDIIQVNIPIFYKFKELFYEKIYLKLYFIYILFFIFISCSNSPNKEIDKYVVMLAALSFME